MKNAIVFHPNLFEKITGSGEKLLVNIAQILADSDQFLVWCVYGSRNQEISIPDVLQSHDRVKLLPFTYDAMQKKPPWKPVGMIPQLSEIMDQIGASIFICLVSDGDQWPITSLPTQIPILLISPFGDFCSNGNVRRLYVSGRENLKKLQKKRLDFAEVFFNPLHLPIKRKNRQCTNGSQVVLGRLGRSDSYIFDPISIHAYARLEAEFGEDVSYIYVNPSQEAIDLAEKFKLKRIFFRNWLNEDELTEFYNKIDIFAHARRDGETLGVAIGEAMLHECVVASHKSEYFNEHLFLVREPFGLIAELDDVDHYYENLKKFVTNREQLGFYGEKARAFASKYFEWETVARKIIRDCNDLWHYIDKPLPVHVRLNHKLLKLLFWVGIFFRKIKNTYNKLKL